MAKKKSTGKPKVKGMNSLKIKRISNNEYNSFSIKRKKNA